MQTKRDYPHSYGLGNSRWGGEVCGIPKPKPVWRTLTKKEAPPHMPLAVSGDFIVFLQADGDVWCLNRLSGKRLWQSDTIFKDWFGSVTIIDGLVFACESIFELATGEKIGELERPQPKRALPAILAKQAYLEAIDIQNQPGLFRKFDTQTRQLETIELPLDYGAASPSGQYLVGRSVSESGVLTKVEIETGRVLWEVPGINSQAVAYATDDVLYQYDATRLSQYRSNDGAQMWSHDYQEEKTFPLHSIGKCHFSDQTIHFVQSCDTYVVSAETGKIVSKWTDHYSTRSCVAGDLFFSSHFSKGRLDAFDRFTGEMLWTAEFPNVGGLFDIYACNDQLITTDQAGRVCAFQWDEVYKSPGFQ